MTLWDVLIILVFMVAFLGIWEEQRDNATSLYHRLTRRLRKRVAKRRGWRRA